MNRSPFFGLEREKVVLGAVTLFYGFASSAVTKWRSLNDVYAVFVLDVGETDGRGARHGKHGRAFVVARFITPLSTPLGTSR